MMCSRLAQGIPYLGQMEHKWRWPRSYVTKYVNHMLNWVVDEWGHLLELNVARMSEKAHEYATAVGRKLGFQNPAACRCIMYIDGVFM